MMASRYKKTKRHFELSESSHSESSDSLYPRKKFKRIIVGGSSLTDSYYPSTDEDDNSGPKFINRKENSVTCMAIRDRNSEFKSGNKENTCRVKIKPIIESKGKYNLDKDSLDLSASSDDDTSNKMNKVEVVGSSRKINNGSSANKYDAPNSIITITPLAQNQQPNKNQQNDTNIRHRIMKMAKELKYTLSKFKLEVYHFQLKYLEDEIVTEQEVENIMHNYNSIINNLKKELTVQQQNSMGPYHRCGETDEDSRSNSEIFSANCKRPKVTEISKPDVTDNANKQSLEENCTSAVTVEKNSNTTSKSDQASLISRLKKLKEIKFIKSSSKTLVAGSISSTARSVPDFKVLNLAYKKSIGRQSTTKQDSLSNVRVKEKVLPVNYESDVNSTCSTIALHSQRNITVEINNHQGGFKHADANKYVSRRIVSNRGVLNRDVSKSPISDVSSEGGEGGDEIPFTNLYSSNSTDTLNISNNKIRHFKHKSKYYNLEKGKTVLISSNNKNIRTKQQSEFVVPNNNTLSTNYWSHHGAISNRAYSVPERKPTEQNQYNTRVDEKLRMNCQVVIENFKIR